MKVKPGLIFGEQLKELISYAKSEKFAIPSVNITSFNIVNGLLEGAKKVNSPIIINMSRNGAHFMAGKSLDNTDFKASTKGATLAAKYIHEAALEYKVPVIIQNDHAPKDSLPWIDSLLDEDNRNFEETGMPLFSFHMLDLSEQSLEENISICKSYLEKFQKSQLFLEFEIGLTGGVEDGIDNTHAEKEELYTKPSDIVYAFKELSQISKNFLVAASFGNVHGVYKPGNVKLEPKILKQGQEAVRSKFSIIEEKPLSYVFHGGSGSSTDEIREAINYGVVKMNVDTDFQWAFWAGIKKYYDTNKDFLQSQLGNPKGEDKPNKEFYDPRAYLRSAEESVVERLIESYEVLNCINRN